MRAGQGIFLLRHRSVTTICWPQLSGPAAWLHPGTAEGLLASKAVDLPFAFALLFQMSFNVAVDKKATGLWFRDVGVIMVLWTRWCKTVAEWQLARSRAEACTRAAASAADRAFHSAIVHGLLRMWI